MASYTPNLNLKKPALTDSASIADINGNMDTLDTAVAGKALKTEAIKNITRSGTTFTATRCDNTTFTFTQQDNDHYAWNDITGKPSYYDGAAIKNITRSGTTFTATKMDGSTFTFTQQDNDHYAWSDITGKPSYYDGAAIKNITRSGTTFTATKMDGTTFTFTQQDNNTTYSAGTDMSLSGTTFNHSNSGVTAGTYGPSGNVTGNNSATISVPQITVNARGHVTGVTNRTYTSVDTNTWRPVQNNLTSNSTTDCLSARQGKELWLSLQHEKYATTMSPRSNITIGYPVSLILGFWYNSDDAIIPVCIPGTGTWPVFKKDGTSAGTMKLTSGGTIYNQTDLYITVIVFGINLY